MKKYIAYGSNLNIEQMERRCPGAKIVGTGMIFDYRLVYRGNARGLGVGNLIPDEGLKVPAAVWKITKANEAALDIYEGFPHLYQKRFMDVDMDDGSIENGLIYLMPDTYRPARPSYRYIDIIRQGYEDFGLDTDWLDDSLFFNYLECPW